MKKSISEEIKKKAIEDYLDGLSYREVANKYNVDHKTVRRWFIKSDNKSRDRVEALIVACKELRGFRRSPNSEFKKGQSSWNKDTKGIMKINEGSFKSGEHRSPNTEFKRVKEHVCYIDGKGGMYPYEFNNKLKSKIRKRDSYICQNCSMTEEEHISLYKRKLHIHHIDYDRDNCIDMNLITLCLPCNLKANYERDCWEKYYKNKMRGIIYD
jgi:transposase-like protein